MDSHITKEELDALNLKITNFVDTYEQVARVALEGAEIIAEIRKEVQEMVFREENCITKEKETVISDTKKKTVSEVLTNMTISYPIHFLANYIILPFYALAMYEAGHDFWQFTIINLQLGVWFTVVSFIRLFVLRRIFNKMAPNDIGYDRLLRRVWKAIK